MPIPGGKLRAWLRTADGRLATITLILAILALAVFLVKPHQTSPANNGSSLGNGYQSIVSPMIQDLRHGMRHDEFLRIYGKPRTVEPRSDGLRRLHYDHVIVTFDRFGNPIEILAP